MKFKTRRYYLYYLGRTLAFLFSLIPLRTGIIIGGILGSVVYRVLPKYRGLALDNLTMAFGGGNTPREIRKIARGVFENLGKNAIELINFPKINETNIDKIVKVRNLDILVRAKAKGRGIIIVTAHFGNWELLAVTLTLKGYGGSVIGRRIYFDKYDRYMNNLRKSKNLGVIYRDDSPRKILQVLKDNRLIGILADQDVDSVEGVFVNFFGRPAYTPAGPAAIARASDAALIPVFIIRKNGRHELVIEEPIELTDTGDKSADLIKNTQKWSDVVESYIRRYPEQWVWMHRRWKTKPV